MSVRSAFERKGKSWFALISNTGKSERKQLKALGSERIVRTEVQALQSEKEKEKKKTVTMYQLTSIKTNQYQSLSRIFREGARLREKLMVP